MLSNRKYIDVIGCALIGVKTHTVLMVNFVFMLGV